MSELSSGAWSVGNTDRPEGYYPASELEAETWVVGSEVITSECGTDQQIRERILLYVRYSRVFGEEVIPWYDTVTLVGDHVATWDNLPPRHEEEGWMVRVKPIVGDFPTLPLNPDDSEYGLFGWSPLGLGSVGTSVRRFIRWVEEGGFTTEVMSLDEFKRRFNK